MLLVLVQPVLKCMQFLHTIVMFILTASYHVGRTVTLVLAKACDFLRDVFTAFAIIGEELFYFLCELNTSITEVSSYIRSSANGGINCVVEAIGVFIKHLYKIFFNTRLHSKLLATHIGSFIGSFFNLLKDALLLIADCAWWLITLLPRWLLYAIIAAGDFIVDCITTVRKSLVYTTQLIVDDIFRLTIGIAAIFLLWHNRRRLGRTAMKWSLKAKRFIRMRLITRFRRMFRIRLENTFNTRMQFLLIQRRSPLPRPSISPNYNDKILDPAQRCVICTERQKCVLLLPCKHLCLCEECADYMLLSAPRQNCPLCRTFIEHSMSVYI